MSNLRIPIKGVNKKIMAGFLSFHSPWLLQGRWRRRERRLGAECTQPAMRRQGACVYKKALTALRAMPRVSRSATTTRHTHAVVQHHMQRADRLRCVNDRHARRVSRPSTGLDGDATHGPRIRDLELHHGLVYRCPASDARVIHIRVTFARPRSSLTHSRARAPLHHIMT